MDIKCPKVKCRGRYYLPAYAIIVDRITAIAIPTISHILVIWIRDISFVDCLCRSILVH